MVYRLHALRSAGAGFFVPELSTQWGAAALKQAPAAQEARGTAKPTRLCGL